MERRSFLKKAGIGAAATASAATGAQAFAADGPSVRWRLTSSFPKSLDALWGGGPNLAKRVAELTGVNSIFAPSQQVKLSRGCKCSTLFSAVRLNAVTRRVITMWEKTPHLHSILACPSV